MTAGRMRRMDRERDMVVIDLMDEEEREEVEVLGIVKYIEKLWPSELLRSLFGLMTSVLGSMMG